MYLSEIFIREYSKSGSALDALMKCNGELCKRMNAIQEPEDCMKYFFYLITSRNLNE